MQSQNLALEHAYNYHLNSFFLKISQFFKILALEVLQHLTLHYHYGFVK